MIRAGAASDEIEFGREWSDTSAIRCELSWVVDTGELYSMGEPIEPIASDGIGDLRVQNLPTSDVTVEVLGVVEDRETLDRVLGGWQDAMSQPNSLEWVRARIASPPEPGSTSGPDTSTGTIGVTGAD